jgi:hypothetical protein
MKRISPRNQDHTITYVPIASFQLDEIREEIDRDVRGSGKDIEVCDLLQTRWKATSSLEARLKVDSMLTCIGLSSIAGPLANQPQAELSTPTHRVRSDSWQSLGQDPVSKRGSLHAIELVKKVWGGSRGSFRPDFIDLQYKPSDKRKFEEAVAFWQEQSPELAAYRRRAELNPKENTYTQKFCNLVDQIGNIIHGTGRRPRLVFGDKKLERNDSLVFHDGQGGDWTLDGNPVKPDLQIFDFNEDIPDVKNWRHVWLAAEVRLLGRTDMKSSHSTAAENIIPRSLYYQVSDPSPGQCSLG